MARLYSEKRAEVIAQERKIGQLPNALTAVLEEFGVDDFQIDLPSAILEQPTPQVALPSSPDEQLSSGQEITNEEKLPEIEIDKRAREAKINGRQRRFRADLSWEVFLSVFASPEGATEREVEEAARRGGSEHPERVSTHISNLKQAIEEDLTHPIIVKIETPDGVGYVPKAKVSFTREQSKEDSLSPREILLARDQPPPLNPNTHIQVAAAPEAVPSLSASGDVFVAPSTNGDMNGQDVRSSERKEDLPYHLTNDEIFALTSIVSFLYVHGDLKDGRIPGVTGQQILRRFMVNIEPLQRAQMVKELSSIGSHGEIDHNLVAIYKSIIEKSRGFVGEREKFIAQNGSNLPFIFRNLTHFRDHRHLSEALFVFFDTYAKVRFDPSSKKYGEWQASILAPVPI